MSQPVQSQQIKTIDVFLIECAESNRPLVCVQGLGYVGLAMATVIAHSLDSCGNPIYNVVGVDLPENKALIQAINKGTLPIECEDKDLALELRRAVKINKNLVAGHSEKAYEKADIVVVDLPLGINKLSVDDYTNYQLCDKPFRDAMRRLGRRIRPECLVLIETTLPPGFCSNVCQPILTQEFLKRGIKTNPRIAHSYERVMPGKDYLNSIRKYFRTFAGIDETSSHMAEIFLSNIIDTNNFPLKEEASLEASELAKVLENSYRAVNIAMIYEWTLLAEKMEINLFSVTEGIKKRPTHSNIMKPGFGVGGYCLTKDSLLALWSADHLYKSDFGLPLSKMALQINDRMPLHTLSLIKNEIDLYAKRVAVLGISYREDVGDTRFSPAELFCRELSKYNVDYMVHDCYVERWPEVPEANFISTLEQLRDADVIVLAVRHQAYLSVSGNEWVKFSKDNALFVDANNVLDDEKIVHLLENKRNVIGVGKGHIKKIKRRLEWQGS